MEYLRRGRPLRKTGWSIKEVSRYMRFHVHGKSRHEDIGVFAKFFVEQPDGGLAPFPEEMIAWEKVHHKVGGLMVGPTTYVVGLLAAISLIHETFSYVVSYLCTVLGMHTPFSQEKQHNQCIDMWKIVQTWIYNGFCEIQPWHQPVQEEHEKAKLPKSESLAKALIGIETIPKSGYVGVLDGNFFVITHPELPEAVEIKLHP